MEQKSNGKAIASLILGIISCAGSISYIVGWFVGIICGIIAIVFGVKARKEEKSGMALAGFILGIIGTSLCSLTLLGALMLLSMF